MKPTTARRSGGGVDGGGGGVAIRNAHRVPSRRSPGARRIEHGGGLAKIRAEKHDDERGGMPCAGTATEGDLLKNSASGRTSRATWIFPLRSPVSLSRPFSLNTARANGLAAGGGREGRPGSIEVIERRGIFIDVIWIRTMAAWDGNAERVWSAFAVTRVAFGALWEPGASFSFANFQRQRSGSLVARILIGLELIRLCCVISCDRD